MLKPALARGELHAIGATTLDEYRKYIEKDAALERRFQPVHGRRAHRGGHHRHPARPEGEVRDPPRRPHHRCRHRGRGRAVEPLHLRPFPARQGHRPDGRGGQPPAHRDRLHARGGRPGRAQAHPDADRGAGADEGERRGQQGAPRGAAPRHRRRQGGARRPQGRVEEREGRHPERPGAQGRHRGGADRGGARHARGRPVAGIRDPLCPHPRAEEAARGGRARPQREAGRRRHLEGGGVRGRDRRGGEHVDGHPGQQDDAGRDGEARRPGRQAA